MDAKLHADDLIKVFDLVVQGSKQVHAIFDRIVKSSLKETVSPRSA